MIKRLFLALAVLGIVAGALAVGVQPVSACSYDTHSS
jgi:hypothetical protein